MRSLICVELLGERDPGELESADILHSRAVVATGSILTPVAHHQPLGLVDIERAVVLLPPPWQVLNLSRLIVCEQAHRCGVVGKLNHQV